MKRQLATMVCGALLISSATMAFASPYPQDAHGQNRGDNGSAQQRDQHGHGNQGKQYVQHDRGNHEGWYKRGGYVPQEYRGNSYVVTDWRARHLREPPRGYHWVRSDNGDFLMVAITTGLIASILAQH